MSMIVAHNLPGMNTQRQFGVSARGMSSSMEKLSSGFKINTGKDDPAGLLISEKLRSQMMGITRAKQNTEEAMNVMGIAEGALNEMNNILKKMKSLATHSSNSGVTTADQIQADQSEMDSAIQTLDRIAQTTEFSGEKLLNGAKEVSFSTSTDVKGTQQNALINQRESSFDQIFKRDGYSVSIGFTGGNGNIAAGTLVDGVAHAGSQLTGDGKEVDFSKQATKAYMEIDTAIPDANSSVIQPKAQLQEGLFTQEQQFTLTGSLGSRQFTFAKNKSITDLVKDIHNTAGSTGVDAQLIFNSDQTVNKLVDAATADATNGVGARDANAQVIFGSSRVSLSGNATVTGNAGIVSGATAAQLTNIQFGKNTDGQGNVYIKYVSDTEIELYKDASMSKESLVATGRADGTGNVNLRASNNSGLGGTMTIVRNPDDSLSDLKGNFINTGGLEATNGMTWSGDLIHDPEGADDGCFTAAGSIVTGVELGRNTDETGKIYFKMVNDGNNVQMFAYKDKQMREEDLVAQSDKVGHANSQTITLNQVYNSDGTAGTGLSVVFTADAAFGPGSKGTTTGNLTFENLGARLFATEYGSENFIKVTQDKGAILTSFDSPGDEQRTMLETGKTKLIYGQDATVSVNGMEVKTEGLDLKVATQDIQAKLSFNGGKVGSTTIAQVGYDAGSVFTRAGALNLKSNVETTDDGLSAYLCNAGHTTNETIGDFEAGMQLQLGEGAGDQNRTVVSMKSMTTENLGRIVRGGYWDTSNPSVYSEKTFTMKDCFGGGGASLYVDPTLTMAVIDKAIDDIAGQRATIGAMQSNLLQTNANNLEVALENITKTESGIRDADMATEMAEFTKNQVLQNAAMSMMSQANQQSQQALQLLN